MGQKHVLERHVLVCKSIFQITGILTKSVTLQQKKYVYDYKERPIPETDCQKGERRYDQNFDWHTPLWQVIPPECFVSPAPA